MLPKILCDVASVEFLKMLRLTSTVLEPLSFSVPRVKVRSFWGQFPGKLRVIEQRSWGGEVEERWRKLHVGGGVGGWYVEGDMEGNVEGCGEKNWEKMLCFGVRLSYKLTILTMIGWR